MRRGNTFDLARDKALAPLADADRRLAHEIAAGVLRQRATLDADLAPRVANRWEKTPDDLRDILRIAAYQIARLDRVPAYAAVSDAVSLARAVKGERSAAFVNAVLRRLTREPATSDGGEASLAQRHAHPPWLVERWVERFGEHNTARLLQHNNRRPPVVIQPTRWPIERIAQAFAAAGLPVERHAQGGLRVRGKVDALPGYADGAFVVQDPAQTRLLQFAAIPDGARVWDACAAPGGKSARLALSSGVIATDRGAQRMARLVDTVRRAAPTVRVARADARQPPFRSGAFDVVLVDAPCSATGTLARHPDARWRLTPERIVALAELQGELLRSAAESVRPGGLLVYLTCSLEPEENASQVNALLAARPDLTRSVPDCEIFPPDADSDGGFGARLVRAA